MSFRCRRRFVTRLVLGAAGIAGGGVGRGRRVASLGTLTRLFGASFSGLILGVFLEASSSVGVRILPAAFDTLLALLYIFLRWSPTSRKTPGVFQHDCVVQDPLTPWHLQMRRIVFFTACRNLNG